MSFSSRGARTGVVVCLLLLGGACSKAEHRSAASPATSTFATVVADDGVTITYRGMRVTVPKAWPVVDLEGTAQCGDYDHSAAYVGAADDAECGDPGAATADTLWLLPLDLPNDGRDAPSMEVGQLTGLRFVEEEDRVGFAFPDLDVYLFLTRAPDSALPERILATVRGA